MVSFRILPASSRRAVLPRPGLLAFGVALMLGLGLGALVGRGWARAVWSRTAEAASERAGSFAKELNRGLDERRKALHLLATMPSVVAKTGQEGQAFASFRKLYPEFERVGVATSHPSGKKVPHRGPRSYRLTVVGPGGRISGTLRRDWSTTMTPSGLAFGIDSKGTVTLLMGSGGSRTENAPEPVASPGFASLKDRASAILPWSDGTLYLTSIERLNRSKTSAPDLAIVTGVPMARLSARTGRAQAAGVLFGLVFGIFAGTVAWVGIARSTRRLQAANDALERRVTERTAELAAAERSFRGIFENVPLGLYQCDPSGRFLRVNPTLASTLGYDSPDALIAGLGSLQAIGDLETRARFLERLNEEGEVRDAITPAQRADGGAVWLAERARAVRNEQGETLLIEGAMHDVTAQRELEGQLRRMGETDPLTGLFNRRGLTEAMAAAGVPVSFVALDVDLFKAYNDTYGHPAGDRALQAVAEVLRRTVRASDLVARAGGEEFVVVLPRTGAAGAHRVAEALRAAIEAGCHDLPAPLTVSGGVATAVSVEEIGEAFAAADRALYLAKAAGRNRVVVNPVKLA